MKKHIIGAIACYCGIWLFLTAVLLAAPSVYILTAIFAMAALTGVSVISNLYVKKHLRAAIKINTTTAKDSAVVCNAEFFNNALLPAARIFCGICLQNDLTGEKEYVLIKSAVGAKSNASESFLLQSRYSGRMYISIQDFYITDYFGIIPIKIYLKASARITVLPELFACELGERFAPSMSEEGYADKKGDDRTEIFQLREYQSGDDIKQIHWKLSSKLDEIILKEASRPQSKYRLVFWDKRVQSSPAQMNALADSVASVCNALYEKGEQFRLCYTERDELREWDITDDNVLLQAIPALVKCAGSSDCPDPDLEGYGSILYFSSEYKEELAGDERIVQMICTYHSEEENGAIVFSPENYRERLERLEI